MRRTLSLVLVLGLATSAQAEDFTGAYAGVNLGYGFERGRDAKTSGAVPGARAGTPSANDLPPSASLAAKSLRASSPAASR
ncbi:hypothetical protein FV229_19810 [Methylobacterium sp. WL120]|nr:hypothetical protein [Methylobacterium sp. WL120]TXM64111.1 hypothetical protein FV229_19810 [Methylobacterium sp. WL120]